MYRIISFIRRYNHSKHYRVLQFSMFFLIWSISFAIFEYFVPLYLSSLGLSLIIIGIISSGTSFISFFIDPILGHIQKKYPPRTLLITSILLFVINILLLISSKSIVFLLFMATSLYGIAFDIFSITSYKIIFDNSVESDRCENISFLEVANNLGILIGASIAGFLFALGTRKYVMLTVIILSLLVLLILFTTRKKNLNIKESLSCTIRSSYSAIFRELSNLGMGGWFLILLLIFVHLWDGFFFVFEPIFSLKFSGYALNANIIGGLLLGVYTLPTLLFEVIIGKLEDRFGREKFVISGFLISAFAVFLLQTTDNLIITFLAVFLSSLGFFAIALPAIEGIYEAFTEKKFCKKQSGESVSIMEITLSVGFFFGPILGGVFASLKNGFNSAFRIFSVLTLAMLVLSIIVFWKRIRKPKRHTKTL